MGDYRDLRVWQAAVDLAVDCYSETRGFPKTERFGITGQMRRASVSVSANIAEGAGRKSDREFARFVRIAGGSANELETLLRIARRLDYLDAESHASLEQSVQKVRRSLGSLQRSLRAVDR
ncbi:MAG: four helix bundle protein [Acidimicrobiia bacterium]|nr:four helix bundle protein [Acidimicrobiia bacterium]RZV40823.1 MAG: four helix bundle protein [Acidimicrobiia bacterium]